MAQFFAAKAQTPDALVFFRMGDFYELFFEDAAKAADALGIALTHRGTHAGQPIPMAGVPAHAAEAYLAKLIRAGFKVAVCEQVEAPAAARARGSKAVVRRDVVRVVTPGTLTEDALLDARGANRLAAISSRAGVLAVASLDLSTGEVECQTTPPAELAAVLSALRPAETLISDRLFSDPAVTAALQTCGGVNQPMAAALAEPSAAEARLKRLYRVATLEGFGVFSGAEIAALGLLGAHLEATQGGSLPVLKPPRRLSLSDVMLIDAATRVGLEIERNLAGDRQGSLLAALDRTVTGPGARLLAARLSRPLTDVATISERLDAVGWLKDQSRLRERLRERLRRSGDLARSLSRLSLGRGGPRDLGVLRDALEVADELASLLAGQAHPIDPPPRAIETCALALRLADRRQLMALCEALRVGLDPQAPILARDGGFVAAGYRSDLDEARSLRDDGRKLAVALEAGLSQESGIPLRVRHNAVLGYFLETNARQAEPLLRPPLCEKFIHRQTLANQVRFTTPELIDLDARIARAGDRALALELEIFEDWRRQALACASDLLSAADALAGLDAFAGLAEWADECGAVRPVVDDSFAFEVEGARHPVVEAAVKGQGEAFTPNSCSLDGEGRGHPRLLIVTGPNMAGKSTFLRQNALMTVMAQAGSFVPATSLRLGVVDRLFSRIGAGDDLARGRSTFMAEMVETAAILNAATARSFVVLDEIGRGTATWDGLAIAWACAEALHDVNRCRALFATHYHELAGLEGRLAHLANASLRAKEWNGDLIFLHEVGPGPADRSYGVQVAKLAGVPAPVVARAREVLSRLEQDAQSHGGLEDLPLFAAVEAPLRAWTPSPAEDALKHLDPDAMSPREALEALYRLKDLLA